MFCCWNGCYNCVIVCCVFACWLLFLLGFTSFVVVCCFGLVAVCLFEYVFGCCWLSWLFGCLAFVAGVRAGVVIWFRLVGVASSGIQVCGCFVFA